MRRKILSSVVVTVLFALIIITSSFFAIISMQEVENTKKTLNSYNLIISKWKDLNPDSINLLKINDIPIDVVIVNSKGIVLFDNSSKEEKSIDLKGGEFTNIQKNNIGEYEGYSPYYKKDMIFTTLRLENGDIIRSGFPIKSLEILYSKNMNYYLGILAVVFLLSIALAFKLVRIIIDPVKNLEYVSSKIANGDLTTRIEITSKDELGYLGKSFNNMADQLQNKIDEVTDKQNKLESILRCMQSGVIAVDKEKNIILVNPYAKDVLGINKDVVGIKLNEVVEEKIYNKLFIEEYDTAKEIKVKSPIRRILRVKKTAIINAYETIGTVISIQDITEMKRLENMRTQFVANVSHELKTPLTSIKGFAETLRFVEEEETKNKFLDIIDKEADRLKTLIEDILILSSLESRSSDDLVEFYPDEVILDAMNILEEHAKKKNIELVYESKNKYRILGHNDKFLQMIINLGENAIKYSERDKKVIIESYSKEGKYIFKVKDSGYGIPKEDLPHIFERFYRVDKSRKGNGTGLGLAIVKHISKTFGGDIEVNSEVGKGSEFTFKVKYLK